MQITTNDTFVSRRALIGRWCTIGGFVVLIAGMFVSLEQPRTPDPSIAAWILFLPWVTLLAGIILLNVGKYNSMRYGSGPSNLRVDKALARALKSLDHHYHLYSFVPNLPTEHLLVTPQGVVVIAARPFIGEVIHQGSNWKRPLSLKGLLQLFGDGGLGNPTREAAKDAEAVQQILRERLGDDVGSSIMVFPIIVLTNSRVKLTVTDPEIPVVMIGDIRGAVRQLRDGHKLTGDVQRQLVRALQWDPAQHALSTSRSST